MYHHDHGPVHLYMYVYHGIQCMQHTAHAESGHVEKRLFYMIMMIDHITTHFTTSGIQCGRSTIAGFRVTSS